MARRKQSYRPTVLLTGFGPFPKVPANVSGDLVTALAPLVAARFPNVHCLPAILPTEWGRAPARLDALVRDWYPVIILQFGISPKAKGFVIETRARNKRKAALDAAGCKPDIACVEVDGPDFRQSSLPVAMLVERLRALGLPAKPSKNAGQYLCNALLYHGLASPRYTPQSLSQPLTGFVHLPINLTPSAAEPEPPLTFDRAVTGGLEIVTVCLEQLSLTA
jgi:pyroglutamyl-peptidase